MGPFVHEEAPGRRMCRVLDQIYWFVQDTRTPSAAQVSVPREMVDTGMAVGKKFLYMGTLAGIYPGEGQYDAHWNGGSQDYGAL